MPARGRLATTCALLSIAALVALGAGRAWAHDDAVVSGAPSIASSLAMAVSLRAIAGVALALLAAAPALCLARRRATALSLIVITLAFAFETGLHSTHHLSEPGKAADCAVAAASVHNVGDTVDGAGSIVAPIDSPQALTEAPPAFILALRLLPHENRGPPPPTA